MSSFVRWQLVVGRCGGRGRESGYMDTYIHAPAPQALPIYSRRCIVGSDTCNYRYSSQEYTPDVPPLADMSSGSGSLIAVVGEVGSRDTYSTYTHTCTRTPSSAYLSSMTHRRLRHMHRLQVQSAVAKSTPRMCHLSTQFCLVAVGC